MNATIKKFQNLKNELNEMIELNRENEALKKVTLKQLKDEFNCTTIEEIEELLKTKKREKLNLDKEFEELVEELEEQMKELELIDE